MCSSILDEWASRLAAAGPTRLGFNSARKVYELQLISSTTAENILSPREAARLAYLVLYSTPGGEGRRAAVAASPEQRFNNLFVERSLQFDNAASPQVKSIFWMMRPQVKLESGKRCLKKKDAVQMVVQLANLLRLAGRAELLAALTDSAAHTPHTLDEVPFMLEKACTVRENFAAFRGDGYVSETLNLLAVWRMHKLATTTPATELQRTMAPPHSLFGGLEPYAFYPSMIPSFMPQVVAQGMPMPYMPAFAIPSMFPVTSMQQATLASSFSFLPAAAAVPGPFTANPGEAAPSGPLSSATAPPGPSSTALPLMVRYPSPFPASPPSSSMVSPIPHSAPLSPLAESPSLTGSADALRSLMLSFVLDAQQQQQPVVPESVSSTTSSP